MEKKKYGITTTGTLFEIVGIENDVWDVLLHIGDGVKQPFHHNNYYDNILYSFSDNNDLINYNQYKDYEYNEKDQLSNEEIIKTLKKVIYYYRPRLFSSTMTGWNYKKGLEYDPNYYDGTYILDDNNVYCIIKNLNFYKIFKGYKVYPDWDNKEDLIYDGKLNMDIYKKSIELYNLRRSLISEPSYILDHDIKKLNNILKLDEELQSIEF